MVKKLGDFISKFYLALVFIFLYAPIVTLMIFSFNKTKSMAVWGGFTFDWYSSLLENDRIIDSLLYSFNSSNSLCCCYSYRNYKCYRN